MNMNNRGGQQPSQQISGFSMSTAVQEAIYQTATHPNEQIRNAKYLGISWDPQLRAWRTKAFGIHVGYFDDPAEAARAFDEAKIVICARQNKPITGKLNFPGTHDIEKLVADNGEKWLKYDSRRRPVVSRGVSKYRGVIWEKKSQKWRARIKLKGKTNYLGTYTDEKEAALAYDKGAIALLGDDAILNFPDFSKSNVKQESYDSIQLDGNIEPNPTLEPITREGAIVQDALYLERALQKRTQRVNERNSKRPRKKQKSQEESTETTTINDNNNTLNSIEVSISPSIVPASDSDFPVSNQYMQTVTVKGTKSTKQHGRVKKGLDLVATALASFPQEKGLSLENSQQNSPSKSSQLFLPSDSAMSAILSLTTLFPLSTKKEDNEAFTV